MSAGAPSNNIAYVSVGVADMNAVRRLWLDQFGLEVIASREGPDPALSRLWGLGEQAIVEQLLLGTPGATTGRLHFVQFAEPGAAVRDGAAPTDLGAKNIDVNCRDMPALVERLRAAGYRFRSAISEYEIDGLRVREVQMPAHDGLNVVLIEVLGEGFEAVYTAAGFAALTSFVVIVPDVAREAAFFKDMFDLAPILHHKLSGPELETAAGLPPGTVLDLHLLGEPDNLFGRVELIEYQGVQGSDLFQRAVPPASGILECGFRVQPLKQFADRLAAAGIAANQADDFDLITGFSAALACNSPAGLRLVLQS